MVGTLATLLLIWLSPTIQVDLLKHESAWFPLKNPALVTKVLAAYEEARKWSLANPAELTKILAEVFDIDLAENDATRLAATPWRTP